MGAALAAFGLLGLFLQATGLEQQRIGYSTEQRPITVYAVGTGSYNVVIVGGIHGAYEANSSWLVWELLTAYRREPQAIPPQLKLFFLPEANPDGLRNGTRFLADGVDANRNWPTADWSAASYAPGFVRLEDGGGREPLSEPETVALADFITAVRPRAVLSYHSA
ncbi:MAG TPA: M14 family zinc carboxypeptidase, partial [Chloroflexota bacterium]|nr:M14 family zinc carboxypeptidase [Chloroflexota bacterium]